MNKTLYVLPVLAVLGMFSVANADTVQERIDKFEAKIDNLQERIDKLQEQMDSVQAKIDGADPATHQKRIDKWEAKIDSIQERIDKFGAKIDNIRAQIEKLEDKTDAQASQQAEEPATEPGTAAELPTEADTTPPAVTSATLDMNAGTVTVVFDETIDISSVNKFYFVVMKDIRTFYNLGDSAFDRSADDSDTVAMTVHWFVLDWIDRHDPERFYLGTDAVQDLAGNAYQNPRHAQLPLTVIPAADDTA